MINLSCFVVLFIYFYNNSEAQQCGLSCPFFTAPSYSESVPENATLNTEVLTVSAYTLNGDSMIYGITYLGQDFPFDIGPTTGIIVVSGALNYQLQSRYDFTVTATMFLGYNKVVACTIYVTDVLDPVACNANPFLVSISENMQADDNVSQCIECISPEQPNEVINYITSSSLLSVDSDGLIWLNETLDYETSTVHNVSLTFTDSYGNKLEGLGSIEVMVLPINEYNPTFNQSEYDFSVLEGSEIGSVIGYVSASDEDNGPDGTLQYAMVNGTEFFHISSDTGAIYSSVVFDHEEQTEYSFTLSVTDRPLDLSTALVDFAIVTIQIMDVNDNPPKFNENPYIVSISETTSPLSVLFTLNCTDVDTGFIEYFLDNETEFFSVNESTGDVMLLSELDFEKDTYHQFTVECIDQSMESFSSQALVIVQVLEVNEHTPYFINNSTLSLSLQDDLTIGSSICTFEAQDEDSGLGGELLYSIIHTKLCPLNIDITSDTGIVFLNDKLDVSYAETLECLIMVQDNLPPIRIAEGSLKLSISSGNNSPPQCESSFTITSVLENTTLGSVIYALNCSDKDNDYLYYSIVSGDQFSISSTNESSDLVLALELDYESQTSHIIVILVYDSKLSTLITMLLIVKPVNEHNPTFNDGSHNCSLIESTSKGEAVFTIIASDKDSGSDGIVKYSLSKQEQFSIDPETGTIYLTGELDYEDITEYEVTVFARDDSITGLQLTSSALVNIQVTDANDNYPIIVPYLYSEVDENSSLGTVISIINCTDEDSLDNGITALEIISVTSRTHEDNITDITANHLFTLDGQNGALKVTGVLDYELVPYYEIVITCKDNGNSEQLSSTSTMILTVRNINEHNPFFNQSVVYTYASVNDKPGTELIALVAMDNDRNDDLIYTMSLAQPQTISTPLFLQLDSFTGVITIASEVHCTDSFEFLYNITATDSGGLTGHSQVFITIEKCPNIPLMLKNDIFTATVQENNDPSTIIGLIECNTPNDLQLPSGSEIHYSLDDYEKTFSVDRTNGTLYCLKSLDYEELQLYVIHSTCFYSHKPDIFRNIIVYLNVLPVNEYSPIFENVEQTTSISEDTIPGTIIASINATDLDQGEDGRLFYSILNTDELEFVIDSNTSNVYLVEPIDRENVGEYTITIVAIDNAVNVNDRKTNSTVLKIVVTDVNDNFPTCSNTIYYATLQSSVPPNTVFETVNCSDIDMGENSTLTYSVLSGNYPLKMSINETTGDVYLKESIGNITSRYHTIPVVVSDGGSIPLTVTVYISILLEVEQTVVEGTETESDTEGWRNNVTAVISNMEIQQVCSCYYSFYCVLTFFTLQWSQNTMTVFQQVIADVTATHCALYPLSCSLLTTCSNVTLS